MKKIVMILVVLSLSSKVFSQNTNSLKRESDIIFLKKVAVVLDKLDTLHMGTPEAIKKVKITSTDTKIVNQYWKMFRARKFDEDLVLLYIYNIPPKPNNSLGVKIH